MTDFFTDQERAAIRAGLLLLECHAYDGWHEEGVLSDATPPGGAPLSEKEIAALARRFADSKDEPTHDAG